MKLIKLKKNNKIYYQTSLDNLFVKFNNKKEPMERFNERYLIGSVKPDKLGDYELQIVDKDDNIIASTIVRVVNTLPEEQWKMSKG